MKEDLRLPPIVVDLLNGLADKSKNPHLKATYADRLRVIASAVNIALAEYDSAQKTRKRK